ncbi:MAG: hypothetical protein WA397_31320 [Roseiarcus sp.]
MTCEDHDLPWALVSQAQDAVRDQLKAPSTAKFPWDVKFKLSPGCVFDLVGTVDSQNAFGRGT